MLRPVAILAAGALAGTVGTVAVQRAADNLPGARHATAHQAPTTPPPGGIAPEPIYEDGSSAVVVSYGPRTLYRVEWCAPFLPGPAGRDVQAPCAMGGGPLVSIRPIGPHTMEDIYAESADAQEAHR